MNVHVNEVKTRREMKLFVTFPNRLFRKEKNYIPALRSSELKTLSAAHNPAFEYCRARYWLALAERRVVGRIAGIINERYNNETGVKYARFGWFDFVENEAVAEALLRTVERWASEQGMEKLQGPLGFVSFDNSGIIVEGFSEAGSSFAHFNRPYYAAIVERLGFRKEVDWLEFVADVPEAVPQRVKRFSGLIRKKYNLRVVEKKMAVLKAYARPIFELINEVYTGLYAVNKLSDRQIEHFTQSFIPFLNPDFVCLVVDEQNQLKALGIAMPALGKAIKKSNGRLFPLGLLRMLWAIKHNDVAELLLIAIAPEFQKKGLNAIIFDEIMTEFMRNGIRWVNITRQLEDNKAVQALFTGYQIRQTRRARAYVKEIEAE